MTFFVNFLVIVLTVTSNCIQQPSADVHGPKTSEVLTKSVIQRGLRNEKIFLRNSLATVRKNTEDVEHRVEDKLKDLSDSLRQEVIALNKTIDKMGAKLTGRCEEKHQALEKDFKGFENETGKSLQTLQASIRQQFAGVSRRITRIQREKENAVQDLREQVESLQTSRNTAINKQDIVDVVTELACGERWLYYDASCYKLYEGQLKFVDAEQACKDAHGFLVEIHSADENKFVAENVLKGRDTWYFIGLKDIGLFSWVWQWRESSRKARYTNWDHGEPNNVGNSELCVEISSRDGEWNNNRCNTPKGFVCEKIPFK